MKKLLCPIDIERLAHWLKQIADEPHFHEETLQGAIQLLITSRQIDRAMQLIRLLYEHAIFNLASVMLIRLLAEQGYATTARQITAWIAKHFRAMRNDHNPYEPHLVLAEATGKLEDIEYARNRILRLSTTDDRAFGLLRIANIEDAPRDTAWIRSYVVGRLASDPEAAITIARDLTLVTRSSEDFVLFCKVFEGFLFTIPDHEIPRELHQVSVLASYVKDRAIIQAIQIGLSPTLDEHLKRILTCNDADPQYILH